MAVDNNKKDVFFYSNFCEHCKNLIGLLIRKNLREKFILVCVDKDEIKSKIPKFIDSVPSILTATKNLYTGEDMIQKYLNSKTQALQETTDEISPYMMDAGFNSSQYTYISSDGNNYDTGADLKNDMLQNNNFVLLSSDQRITAPADREAENKSAKFDSSALEKYMNTRSFDDELIKKTQQQQLGQPGQNLTRR
jgi:hypothetical protein